ncbi:MAG: antibiotic biosynthesis monooxygenase [Acidimicrobiia bacterium]|nr:antibiotic biosynthesis monooxygenase [Acidimicrobiia bacterium]
MSKTSVFVKLVAKPGERDALVAALSAMMPVVDDEEGTVIYSFHHDAADPDTVWAFELYADDEAFATHSGGEVLAGLMGDVIGMIAEPPILAVAEPVHAKGFEV